MNPRVELHLDAAARNQTIATRLLHEFDSGVEPPHDDWVITIAFYSALHLVDAYLLNLHGHEPTNHQQRNRMIVQDPALSAIASEYIVLRTYSQHARYQPLHRFPPHAVQEALDLLAEIEGLIVSELNTEDSPDP